MEQYLEKIYNNMKNRDKIKVIKNKEYEQIYIFEKNKTLNKKYSH